MAQPRITGQDTSISIVVDGVEQLNMTAIKSHEFTYKMKVTEEEYCGETSPRMDDFFMGISGKIDFDLEGIESLQFAEQVVSRARNRQSSVRISVRTTATFPNGDRAIVNIPNCFFADLPFSFAGRSEYGKNTITYSAETARIVSR